MWIADVDNLAGDKQLSTQSYVMTAIKVSDGILIFTGNDVHKMAYVGAPYAYGIVRIATGCGPISPRAVIGVGNVVAWPGVQNFWSYQGTVQPMPCDVQDWFYSLVNRSMVGRIFGAPNPSFAELWWDWPDEGSTECNRYLIWNYADVGRPWSIGVRERTAADPVGTMDYPVLGGLDAAGDAYLFLHEYGWSDDGAPRASVGLVYAESGNIVLGEGDRRYNVTQLVLDTDPSEAPIGFRFFTREQPGDVASEHDTGLYTEVHDGLMDLRFSGRSIRMRMEALADASFAVGKTRLDIKPAGSR